MARRDMEFSLFRERWIKFFGPGRFEIDRIGQNYRGIARQHFRRYQVLNFSPRLGGHPLVDLDACRHGVREIHRLEVAAEIRFDVRDECSFEGKVVIAPNSVGGMKGESIRIVSRKEFLLFLAVQQRGLHGGHIVRRPRANPGAGSGQSRQRLAL